jgi:hypothetical protein
LTTTHLDSLDQPLELLRQVDPLREVPATGGLDEALGEVARAITRQPYATRSSPRTHRRVSGPRMRIALAVGVVALLLGGVATAAVALHAHSGVFASGPYVQPGGPGENLNLAAPDFRSAALKLSANIPYPSGYASWRDFVLTEQAPGPGGATSKDQVTTGALRGWFAASAFCAWVQDWRQAAREGNSAEAQQAASTIAAAPSWSAVSAEDPNPNPSAPNDAGADSGTLFGWMLPYRSAVLSRDSARVDQMLASGYGNGKCWLSDPQWMSELRANAGLSKLSPRDLARQYEQFLARERS